MRVGIVAPVWCAVPPDGYGGTEQVLDALARGLRDLGHDVVLAATADSTCPVERVAVRHHPTPTIGEQVPELQHVLFAYEQLADCDVIHDHTLPGPLLAVGRAGPPVVTTCHGDLCGELADWYRVLSPYAPVIAISRSQASAAPDLPLAVIHHGVVPEDFVVGAGDAGHLLFLGRMSPGKGAHRAAAVARAAGMPLIIAAKMREPAEVAYFERCVRPLLGHGVQFVGEVAGVDKLELLAGAAALLMPIRWPEPFGMVMIEALACGTPVLAFAEGAAPEVVEHGRTGFLCSDQAQMVRAIGRLHELSRLDCRRSVEQRFSAERMARDHLAVYRSLLGGARLPDELHPVRDAVELDATVQLDVDVDARAPQRDPVH